jgi:hypothetical protein
MDYFSATVLVTPAWIALRSLAVLFTRRLRWLYLSVCVLLALVSGLSGFERVREQRSFEERQKAVQAGQQKLIAEFEKPAIALRIPPASPHELIVNRMSTMANKCRSAASRLSTAMPSRP